jgi:hypothetical protein
MQAETDSRFIPVLSSETEIAFMGRHIEVSAQRYRARFEKAISYVYLTINKGDNLRSFGETREGYP